jgi:hypothetical protein
MKMYQRLEEKIIGRVINDLGTVNESIPGVDEKKFNIFLTEKDNQYYIAIKETMNNPEFEAYYTLFSMENVEKLRHFFAIGLKVSNSRPLKPK